MCGESRSPGVDRRPRQPPASRSGENRVPTTPGRTGGAVRGVERATREAPTVITAWASPVGRCSRGAGPLPAEGGGAMRRIETVAEWEALTRAGVGCIYNDYATASGRAG